MESTTPSSKRLVWIVAGIVVLLAILAVVAFFALFGVSQKESTATPTTTNGKAVATKEEIEQNLSDIESSIKDSITDQKAAEAALNDDTKRIDLGS